MSESPAEFPELLASLPGPDPVVRRRLVAGMATIIESERRPVVPAPRRVVPPWSRRLGLLVLVAAMITAFFVPLPRVSLFRRLVGTAPAPAASTTTTTSTPNLAGNALFRAGQPVPVADLLALSFYDDKNGASLVVPPTGQVVQLAVTHDGGASWVALGGVLPLTGTPGLSAITWTSDSGGFAWDSSSIVQLSDGGGRRRTIPIPPGTGSPVVTSVSAVGDTIWASFSSCTKGCPASAVSLSSVWSWSGVTGWRQVILMPTQGGLYVPEIVRLATGTDLVLAQAQTAGLVGQPSGYLFESLDGGRSWSIKPLPCGDITGLEGTAPQRRFEDTPNPTSVVELATPPGFDGVVGGPIVLECQDLDSLMHLEPASIWSLATPVASTWQLLADDLTNATVPYPRLPRPVGVAGWSWGSVLVQSPTPGVLWMDGGHSPSRSTNGGSVWQLLPALGSGIGVLPAIDFVDATHGWCLLPQQAAEGLWSTTNGGQTWTELGQGAGG